MTFTPVFRRIFQSPFDRRDASAGAWWNLFGAIPLTSCVAAYQPKGAASLAASYTNLVTPGTKDAAPGTAPTWDATSGWKFASASSQYLVTGIVPNPPYSMILRWSNNPAVSGYFCGVVSTNMYFALSNVGASALSYLWGNSQQNVTPQISSGITAVTGKSGSNGGNGYRNGLLDKANFGTWSGTNTLDIYIGCRNSGTANTFLSYYCQAFAIYSVELSGTTIAALTTAMNGL